MAVERFVIYPDSGMESDGVDVDKGKGTRALLNKGHCACCRFALLFPSLYILT